MTKPDNLPAPDGGPDPDAGLIAAEATITRLYALPMMQDENSDSYEEPWKAVYDSIGELTDFIATTPPKELAGAAVKLRRLLDFEIGFVVGIPRDSSLSIAQVLDLLQEMVGAPTHPTRPIVREPKLD